MIEFRASFDDGSLFDLQLAELLKKYNIPAVFYIPTCCEILPDHIRELSKTFEIGGHTKTHPMDMKKLTDFQLKHEVKDNKEWLEYLTGKPVTKFCYPRGRYNERVVEVLKEVGFTEARTTIIGCLDKAVDPFRTNTTVHAFQRPEYEGEDWLVYAKRKWREAKNRNDSVFHLWGHSKEIYKYNQVEKLEEFLKYINEDFSTKQN